MKIYLDKKNLRKNVYDIGHIFYPKKDLIFTDESLAELVIKNGKIYYNGKVYPLESKLSLKQNLYEIFEEKTGKSSDWGILTGSKPSKLLQKNSLKEVKDKYKVKDNKLYLLEEIEKNQKKLDFSKDSFNLYINIPFCPQRCLYCSYPTIVSNTVGKSEYVNALIKEIKEINLPQSLDTVYIGGGTPSNLNINDLEKILKTINDKFTFKEFTLEAGREDSLDFAKLRLFKEMNVGRISLNPQTFTGSVLKNIGRDMDFDHFLKLYDYGKDLGFIINMDFIVGLFGEDSLSFRKNFPIIKNLNPHNITFHALAQKIGSKFHEYGISGKKDEAVKISKDIENFTRENSYKPYYLYRQKNIIANLENIGYERENTAQRYNILINEELENIIGLGMNANSKLTNGKKYRNSRNLRDYYENLEKSINDKNKMISKFLENKEK